MTLLPNRIASGEVEAPDVFCGGTPCQAFSVAGLRQSLDDSRGNLSLIFCEIANAIDNIRLIQQSNPAIIFWENVPGVLNTKDNAFGCFLAGLAGESDALIPSGGRWTDAGFIDGPKRAVAWRVLDAQYFGLAQRRKRVFVIASARDDFDPAEVLFEFDGVRRDIAPSRETRKEVTTDAIPSIEYGGSNKECADTVTSKWAKGSGEPSGNECGLFVAHKVYENHPADSRVKEMGETCTTVTSRWGTGGGNVPLVQAFDSYNLSVSDVNQTIKSPGGGTLESVGGVVQQAFRKSRRAQSVDDFETWVDDGLANTLNTFDLGDIRTTHAVAYSFDSLASNSMKSSNPISGCRQVELSKTLDTSCLNPTANQGGIAVAYSIREDAKANTFSATELDVANSIGALQPSPQSHHAQVFVAQPIVLEDQGGSVINTSQTGIVGTLRRETHGHEPSIVAHAFKVRGGCEGGGKGYLGKDEQVFTISTHQDQHIAVGVDMYNLTTNQESTQTIRGNGHIDHVGGVMQQMAVRRLTPKECERLQGFPDGYTDIRPKGKDTPDGSRYKALGNSWAVPVVAWIGKRINHAIT
jgi:DNA (cytosine-5)-methyltransferase 1